MALIVPSLAARRTAARVTKSLSTQLQIVSAITSYAAAGKDRLPIFGSAGGLAGTISVGGSAFRNGYFRTHMMAWPYLVCPTDAAMLGVLRSPTDERVLEDTDLTYHTTLFYMTAAAFADPLLFEVHTRKLLMWRRRIAVRSLGKVRVAVKKGVGHRYVHARTVPWQACKSCDLPCN